MSDQIPLFDRAPYVADSKTSKAAAEAIEPKMGTLRYKVLKYLREHPQGATDEQMQIALAMNPSTQRPRRVELWDKGFVRKSGREGVTLSGRSADIWEAVERP